MNLDSPLIRVFALAMVLLHPIAAAGALPDLVPEVFDVAVGRADVVAGDVAEGCAGGPSDRLLIQYSLRSRNIGTGDLIMGAPMCPNCTTSPGETCGNPLYVCSPAHGHAHFDGFAQSVLLDADDNVVGQSHKSGFCLLDYECATPTYNCGYQGISAGCADVYERGLPCQYMDITDANLASGSYRMRVTLDPLDLINEQDESNNTVEITVDIPAGVGACPRVDATDTPAAIPDNGSVSSLVHVTTTGWVTRVRILDLQVTHPAIGDLEIHLRSPLGTNVKLFDRQCGVSANIDVSLEDSAASAIACPATDGAAHRPSEAVARFVGEEANGTWVLSVFDRATGQSGALVGWGLEICTQPSCDNPMTFTSSEVPKDIDDLAAVSSKITVPEGSGVVARVEVLGLRGLHTYMGDLDFELFSPSGRSAMLLNRECDAHHNFDLSLSSLAPTSIPCPPTDALPHIPASSMTTFIGDLAPGDWNLVIHDRAGADEGTLLAWGLRLCPVVSAAATCPATPASGCRAATRSRLEIVDEGDASDRSFKWKWQGQAGTVAQFGSPSGLSGYAACVYRDGALVEGLPVASAGRCNDRPCWKSLSNRGFRYRQRGANKAGVENLILRAGNSSSRIDLRGRGPALALPLPIGTASEVRVQLIRSDSTICWESLLPSPPARSDAMGFSDRIP